MIALTTLRQVDEVLEEALATIVIDDDNSDATSLQMLDRQTEMPHLGVTIEYPATENQELVPGKVELWNDTDVVVKLAYQSRTAGQKESRRRALDIEQDIIRTIVQWPELQASHPRYVTTTRDPETEPGWYMLDIEFKIHVDTQL